MQYDQFLVDLRNVLEKLNSHIYGHIENIGNRLALELDFKGFAVVAFASTSFARNINIGQEIHFDSTHACALAGFATSASNVEREAPRFVAPYLCFGQRCKKVANFGEESRVSHWVGTRCASNR